MTQRHRLASVLFAAAALTPVTATADSVYLKNGQSFEGVEAVVSGDTVRIDLAIGSMRLPMSKVARIEEVGSTLGEYRELEAALHHERGDAAGWLELARWARAHEFDAGAQKAALTAARLDPDLPALESVMSGLGYVRDEKAREWVPYADAMRRQGLVEDGGAWVTPEEKRGRAVASVEAVPEETGSRADDHLDKALDILAAAVAKPDAPPTTVIVQTGNAGGGLGYFPGFIGGGFVGGGALDPGVGDTRGALLVRAEINAAWDQMARRQPASFIPLPSSGGGRHIDPISHRFVR
jgi:hypothetical protein